MVAEEFSKMFLSAETTDYFLLKLLKMRNLIPIHILNEIDDSFYKNEWSKGSLGRKIHIYGDIFFQNMQNPFTEKDWDRILLFFIYILHLSQFKFIEVLEAAYAVAFYRFGLDTGSTFKTYLKKVKKQKKNLRESRRREVLNLSPYMNKMITELKEIISNLTSVANE